MAELEDIILYGKPEGIKHLQTDISPVLADAEAFAEAAEYMYQMFEREVFDIIIAVDTAGTVFASTVASRKKSPLAVIGTEAGMMRDTLMEIVETHHGATVYHLPVGTVREGQRAVIIGDTLSHGKDVLAAVSLIRKQGGEVVKIGMFLENSDFNARRKLLKGIPLESRIITADL